MTPEDSQKIVKFGTVVKMFQAFAEFMPTDGGANEEGLVYSKSKGRYTNESISKWLDAHADGLVYGVKLPKYEASSSTEAVKTDANAGLVLEASSEAVTGRNDYQGKKLFWCVRVNGGVDADGMPYVTAIEGQDDRFDCKSANTWALTPVYYAKRTETDDSIWNQFSDTQLPGFEPCHGAYTVNGSLRPYILRACYMDSDCDCSSRSGTSPRCVSSDRSRNHGLRSDHDSVAERDDGLTYLSYGDVTYLIEFMQLMLGVKAPKSKAPGYIAGDHQIVQVHTGPTGKSVLAEEKWIVQLGFEVGKYVSVGRSLDTAVVSAVKITSIEASETEGFVAVHLDSPEDVTIDSGSYIMISGFPNGTCDGVLGTYGSFDLDALSEGKAPFRFQNVEWKLGFEEGLFDIMFQYDKLRVLADPSLAFDERWTELCDLPVKEGFVADQKNIGGMLVKSGAVDATATTGCMVVWWLPRGSDSRYIRPIAAGLPRNEASEDADGVGAFKGLGRNASYFTRASAIGHSAIPV